MTSVTRLTLSDDVAELIEQSDPSQAYAVLMLASDRQDVEQEMTLDEALMAIRAVAEQVKAIR